MDEQALSILSVVGSYGFPVVVAWYLLTTLNKTIKEHTDLLTKLCTKLDSLKSSNAGERLEG